MAQCGAFEARVISVCFGSWVVAIQKLYSPEVTMWKHACEVMLGVFGAGVSDEFRSSRAMVMGSTRDRRPEKGVGPLGMTALVGVGAW